MPSSYGDGFRMEGTVADTGLQPFGFREDRASAWCFSFCASLCSRSRRWDVMDGRGRRAGGGVTPSRGARSPRCAGGTGVGAGGAEGDGAELGDEARP